MRRRVLYDATSRAAADAAHLLADAYDVAALSADLLEDAAVPAVVLAEGNARLPAVAGGHVRVVGLVDPAAAGPGPAHCYVLLPAGVGRAVLAKAVANAFTDLDAAAEVARLDRELSELNAIGIRLSAERNPRELLETILTKAREITRSDAGSLYLVEEAPDGSRQLRFALTQNDSVEITFRSVRLPLTNESVVGHVALTGEILNLEDAYAQPAGAPFTINRSFDEQVGYRTKSMLVVPMRTPQGETIGALQLINCKPDFALRLRSAEEAERLVQTFSARHEKLAGSLASQAAVAVANSRLYESIRQLFEGFVKAAVTAIESRDPTTSGHSFRVANLTVGLASVVDHVSTGPYGATGFTADEMMELRYAALLHDFGKVGVREEVLVKAKKLLPSHLEVIRQRTEILKRGLELKNARRKLDCLLEHGRERYAREAPAWDAELAALLGELEAHLKAVATANEPTVMAEDAAAGLRDLAVKTFVDHLGEPHTVITPEEARVLSIARGSLTEEEYRQIQSHVVHTYQFLSQIPWTKELRRVPDIARSHHEKLDGSGYPEGRLAVDIPVQARMMTISDIFDALTASDRPYKAAVPVDRALDILNHERKAGAVDAALLDLFVSVKPWERRAP